MNDFTKSIIAGIVGTVVMSVFMMVAAMLGMPKISPPNMMSEGLGVSIVVGWIIHFIIGITFALIYTYIVSNWLKKISSLLVKGLIFGVIIFVVAQISMGLMQQMMDMPKPEGDIIMIGIASLVGHVIFGVVIPFIVKK